MASMLQGSCLSTPAPALLVSEAGYRSDSILHPETNENVSFRQTTFAQIQFFSNCYDAIPHSGLGPG